MASNGLTLAMRRELKRHAYATLRGFALPARMASWRALERRGLIEIPNRTRTPLTPAGWDAVHSELSAGDQELAGYLATGRFRLSLRSGGCADG